ncbi:alpha/beta hydrolase [Actinomadura opuntiae]|uniref:alpha/beta hydrolase n=1 Tax=Actinomadura sp. OS1-43 TaxID=604315 RepID=UPI00255B069B|nr:alpha/beta hydrolase [Actinomadura sp. OS1-43]MDL4820762.1 alpha/beta hydrolase [Actinomadura sp. OS1-43]
MEQLQKLDLAPVKTAADGWGGLMGDLETGQHTTDRRIMAPLHGTWEGKDAEAAFQRISRLSQNFEYGMTESGDVRTLLASMHAELSAQQNALQQALAQAAKLGFTVSPDGRVGYPASPPMLSGGTATGSGVAPFGAPAGDNRAQAQAIADQIRRAVTQATAIDEKYATALAKLAATADIQVTSKTWADARGDGRLTTQLADAGLRLKLPDGKDPKTTAAWWRSLTPEQRQEYITTHPDKIGALDGLPAEVRDQANRLVLRETRADAQQRLNALGPEPFHVTEAGLGGMNSAYKHWKEQHDELTAQLKGMDSIQRHLDKAGLQGIPDAYFLGFDNVGNGHAIVARGNPDSASHTGVYVPGTFARLSKIDSDLNRSDLLWRASNGLADGQPVSTVTWLGYDAPQDIVTEAPFRSYADQGAPALNQFTDGLRTAHPGSPTHLTLIGHSYGSAVIGSAAIHGHLQANDVIFAGSPGVEADHASDLGIGARHVYTQRAPADPVPPAGTFSELPGHTWTSSHGVPVFGPSVPGDKAFGGQILPYGDDPAGSNVPSAHSSYWNNGPTGFSTSLVNQAAVLVGQR